MRYFWAVLLCACVVRPAPERAGIRSHAVMITDIFGQPLCSGVAVGPRTALTAAHCADRLYAAEGQRVETAIYPWKGRDIMLVSVKQPFRARMAMIRRGRPPAVRIVGWGCSGMTRLDVRDLRADPVWGDPSYLAGRICHGDSGGGVYDPQGFLVAIGVALSASGDQPLAVLAWLD